MSDVIKAGIVLILGVWLLILLHGCNIEVDLSCDIEAIGDGCFHATCDDGTDLTLCNGQDGESCELSEEAGGTCLLSCPATEAIINNCTVLP
jgi:hypothetical protein